MGTQTLKLETWNLKLKTELTMTNPVEATTDHQTIKDWVERRNGRPGIAKRPEDVSHLRLLHIVFPHTSEAEAVAEITWDEFFEVFEAKELAFLRYSQDELIIGDEAHFYQFVNRDRD